MPKWLKEWFRTFALILAGVLIAAAVFGTPHVGWNYACRIPARHGEGGCQDYDWCEYYGMQGRRVLFGEECGGLVRLVPINWRGLIPFSTGDRKNTGLILTPPR